MYGLTKTIKRVTVNSSNEFNLACHKAFEEKTSTYVTVKEAMWYNGRLLAPNAIILATFNQCGHDITTVIYNSAKRGN